MVTVDEFNRSQAIKRASGATTGQSRGPAGMTIREAKRDPRIRQTFQTGDTSSKDSSTQTKTTTTIEITIATMRVAKTTKTRSYTSEYPPPPHFWLR